LSLPPEKKMYIVGLLISTALITALNVQQSKGAIFTLQ
jgi:hypothetical protein